MECPPSDCRTEPTHRSPPSAHAGLAAPVTMTDAVLLIAFGGPTKPDEIRPFLQNVARGRRIPPERLEDVAHHYGQMPGGRSPLHGLSFMQAGPPAALLAGV